MPQVHSLSLGNGELNQQNGVVKSNGGYRSNIGIAEGTQPNIKILNPNHHFRHECELIKQKKGEYLEALIHLPYQHTCFIEISLAPNESKAQCHPNLVHLTIKKQTRRTKQDMINGVKAPTDYISVKEWRIILKKVGKDVTPVKLDTKCIFPEGPVSCIEENETEGLMTLNLSPKGLNVTVVQTLLKPDETSITAKGYESLIGFL